MRQFTIGTLSLCKQLKLSMFTGEGENPELDNQKQVMTFAWMQSAPLREVLQAVRYNKWLEAVEEFEFNFLPSQISEILEEVARVSESIKVATVQVEQKPGSSAEDAPPN